MKYIDEEAIVHSSGIHVVHFFIYHLPPGFLSLRKEEPLSELSHLCRINVYMPTIDSYI